MDTASKLVSRHRRSFLLVFTALLCVMLIMLSACDPRAGNYPDDVHSRWVCDNPEFVLDYTVTDTRETWDAYCVFNGEKYPLIVVYTTVRFNIYSWKNSKDGLRYEDLLVSGNWKYQQGKLVLTIEKDYLFGGEYKTLVFEGSGAPIR